MRGTDSGWWWGKRCSRCPGFDCARAAKIGGSQRRSGDGIWDINGPFSDRGGPPTWGKP